ncbi:methyltransferase domain-containing protein [Streptomyces hirsutus]|uniref:class I SAM-dependent methyltransferase n=1 Tax=Streptomyces hirsutus TaxID=35620 RepID=UPI003404426F
MSDFSSVGAAYAAHSRGARGRLRHDMVARRLLDELPCPRARVLDVGCGDGEMTLRLAAAGHRVTGLDSSSGMLRAAAERAAADPLVSERPVFVEADLRSLPFTGARFDAVCCHGVLMYLDKPAGAVARLATLVAPGGVLSILTKNRRAIGLREALRGRYRAACDLITSGTDTSVGSLGLPTRGDDPDELNRLARENGLVPLPWQGVRALHDHLPDSWAPDEEAYAAALEAEWTASWHSPFRDMGRQVHVLARREPVGRTP